MQKGVEMGELSVNFSLFVLLNYIPPFKSRNKLQKVSLKLAFREL